MKAQYKSLIMVLSLVILFRELSHVVMKSFHHPELGNLVGLFLFLTTLIVWRKFKTIPLSMISSSNILMKESAFAFLPVCVGSLLMLLSLKDPLLIFLIILTLSTLCPLFIYAHLSKKYLKDNI